MGLGGCVMRILSFAHHLTLFSPVKKQKSCRLGNFVV